MKIMLFNSPTKYFELDATDFDTFRYNSKTKEFIYTINCVTYTVVGIIAVTYVKEK